MLEEDRGEYEAESERLNSSLARVGLVEEFRQGCEASQGGAADRRGAR